MRQISIPLETSLVRQFPRFMDCVRASVYGCNRQFKAIAADLDMRASELSRKLADNPDDNVHFPVERLPELVQATGDSRPVLWLAESFLDDAGARKQHAVDRISALLPELTALLSEARDESPIKAVK